MALLHGAGKKNNWSLNSRLNEWQGRNLWIPAFVFMETTILLTAIYGDEFKFYVKAAGFFYLYRLS